MKRARFNTNRKNAMNHTHRRANHKRAKVDLYFSAFSRRGDIVEITAKPDGNGYIWSYQGPDYDDYGKMSITLPFEESYNLFLKEMGLTQGDFWGPEIYTHTANHRANRKRAYFGGERNWEDVAFDGDPIYGSSGVGPDGFYYSFYVSADDFNLVFEAQNEDTMDPEEVWTFEHGGDIPSGEHLAALGDAMATDFVRTGGVSNPIGKVFHRANRKTASEQNPIDNIEVVDGGDGHARIHVNSGNLTVFTIYEKYNTENYYVTQIERLRNRTSAGVGSFLIYPTEFPYLWEFSHFHNGTGELVPDYLLDEMADKLEDIWRSSEFSDVTSSHRANRKRASNDLFDRLLSSPGVFGVGVSGDIMAYVDLPSDEIPSGGTNFYWVVIDSNGDEIVGGSSSSFEEAKSLAENNLFRLSRELYPETYTSRRANRKRASVDDYSTFFIHNLTVPSDVGDPVDYLEDFLGQYFTDVVVNDYDLGAEVGDGSRSMEFFIRDTGHNVNDIAYLNEDGDYRPLSEIHTAKRANRKRANLMSLDEALQQVANASFYEDKQITPETDGNGNIAGYRVEDDYGMNTDDWQWTYDQGLMDTDSVSETSRLMEHYEQFTDAEHIRYHMGESVKALENGQTVTFAYAIVHDADAIFDEETQEFYDADGDPTDDVAGWILTADWF